MLCAGYWFVLSANTVPAPRTTASGRPKDQVLLPLTTCGPLLLTKRPHLQMLAPMQQDWTRCCPLESVLRPYALCPACGYVCPPSDVRSAVSKRTHPSYGQCPAQIAEGLSLELLGDTELMSVVSLLGWSWGTFLKTNSAFHSCCTSCTRLPCACRMSKRCKWSSAVVLFKQFWLDILAHEKQ